jgi:SET domain-containing protein
VEESRCLVVFSVRDIEPGEEICCCYNSFHEFLGKALTRRAVQVLE